MNKYIFENVDQKKDSNWIVKDFFNSVNLRGKFILVIPFIIQRIGCCVEESFCNFPDKESNDPDEKFEGINFGIYGAEVIVSENIGFTLTKEACYRFMKLYSNDRLTIMKFIKDIEEMGY